MAITSFATRLIRMLRGIEQIRIPDDAARLGDRPPYPRRAISALPQAPDPALPVLAAAAARRQIPASLGFLGLASREHFRKPGVLHPEHLAAHLRPIAGLAIVLGDPDAHAFQHDLRLRAGPPG